MQIISLLIELSKILLLIMQKYYAWSEEEKKRFNERVSSWASQAKLILENQENTFDANAYLNAISEEKAIRYAGYYSAILPMLIEGKGVQDLAAIKVYAFNQRFPFIKEKLIAIMNKTLNVDAKAKEMAKEATELKFEG